MLREPFLAAKGKPPNEMPTREARLARQKSAYRLCYRRKKYCVTFFEITACTDSIAFMGARRAAAFAA